MSRTKLICPEQENSNTLKKRKEARKKLKSFTEEDIHWKQDSENKEMLNEWYFIIVLPDGEGIYDGHCWQLWFISTASYNITIARQPISLVSESCSWRIKSIYISKGFSSYLKTEILAYDEKGILWIRKAHSGTYQQKQATATAMRPRTKRTMSRAGLWKGSCWKYLFWISAWMFFRGERIIRYSNNIRILFE